MNERLNIRRLQVPEMVDENRPFDSEKEITAEKWAQIEAGLQEARAGTEWKIQSKLHRYAANMRILRSGDLSLDSKDWSQIEDTLDNQRKGYVDGVKKSGESFLDTLFCVKVLDPSRNFSESDLDKLRENIQECRKGYFGSLIDGVAHLHVIVPEEDVLNSEDWEIMQRTLNDVREKMLRAPWSSVHPRTWSFVSLVSDMRLIRPELNRLTSDDWKLIRYDFRNSNMDIAEELEYMAMMKIAAAETIEVSSQGLRIGPPSTTVEKADEAMPQVLQL
jgi:hypothetical protein